MTEEFSELKSGILDWLKDNREEMFESSDKLFDWAEPGLREYKSSKYIADLLEENGFDVDRGVSGMPTAFNSNWGSEGSIIGFFAEYDATPGHSQKPVPYEVPSCSSRTRFYGRP